MKNERYDEINNQGIEQISDAIIVVTDSSIINDFINTYNITLVIRDLERKNNSGDIRHCIKISIKLMEDGKIKIPSTITIQPLILNNQNSNNKLEISQVSDDILLTYNNSVGKKVKLSSYDSNADEIIDYINSYIYSFNGLKEDNDLKNGLKAIHPTLKTIIEQIFDFWSKFNIESYVEQQKQLINTYKLEYLNKIAPIQKHIKIIEQISNDIGKEKHK